MEMNFEPAKNVNPFLMDDISDYSVPQTDAASSNPFLSSDFTTEATGIENPFLTSSFNETYVVSGTNPFADFGSDYGAADTYQNGSWQQPQATQEYNVFAQDVSQAQTDQQSQVAAKPSIAEQVIETRPNELDLITTSNINDAENDFIVSSDDEAGKPKRPPPPRPSMAKETQDLILSVTGALKATSDHLLDRLPPTRAPSPTAFPEFHSPSPTPDLYSDLLGDEQPKAPSDDGLPAFPSNDNLNAMAQPPRPPAPKAAPVTAAAPPRPPPARPAPPKPAPPSILSQPQPPPQPQSFAQPQEDDMFDLFGTSKPPVPKTKDAILNLYAQPPPKPKDLLSDDFDIPISAPTLLGNQEQPAPKESNAIDLISANKTETSATAEPEIKAPDEAPLTSAPEPPPPSSVSAPPPVPPAPAPTPAAASSPVAAPAPPTPEAIPEITASFDIAKEKKVENTVEAPFQEEAFPPVIQEESYIFGTGPPTEQNTISEPEIARPTEVEPFPEPVEEETHYIFGTKPQEPAIFGTEPNYDNDIPIFGTTKHTAAEHEIPSSEPTIFGTGAKTNEPLDIFGQTGGIFGTSQHAEPAVDAFDAFAAKFEKAEAEHRAAEDPFDPFAGSGGGGHETVNKDVWGTAGDTSDQQQGFGGEDSFDAFLSMSQPPPPPQPTPNRLARTESGDSDEGGFNVFIKPREGDYQGQGFGGAMPQLAPPPKSPVGNSAFSDNGPRFNPFDKGELSAFTAQEGTPLPALSQTEPYEGGFKRSDSQETPPTPLFDEDVSQPLEPFPRIHYSGDGWEMQLRQPNKKKITAQRFWKKIFVKLVYQGDNPVLQLFNLKEDKDPFQELPLQACYSVSDISAQQYDQFGKIFTIKLQYIFYKERPGVRPGQVTKAERITNKLSQFAAYAIQGDYQGVKEFGSDLKKLGLPVEHAPQISQLLKLGCMSYEDLKQFSVTIEECLFRMPVHRDRALNYKMEEVQITVVDEIYVEQDAFGHVEKQVARVRLFFLGFLSGMPDVELGVNDMWRQGKEVVGRHDIIPVVTEEWIRLEAVEFHSCIQQEEYEKTRTIKFKPPDACYIELMRFRIRPPKNRELPLQLKAVMCITGSKVELRADVLVPGFTSRKLGQIPCEDVMIRFPIPECWIYLFRVEKHFRYGSVKSAHRRTGKIKGIERFLGAVDTLEPSLMEVTSGQAKYEHQHRAIVWRMPRLPKEGQGAYTTHNLVCRMQLTSYDQIPDNLAEYAYVEFTMPATQASHTTVRSVSLVDSPSDNPPEKYVRQLARHEYRVGIEHTHQEETAAYVAATITKPKPAPAPETVPEAPPAAESDSESSD